MKQVFYDRLGEAVWSERLPNGLEIRVVAEDSKVDFVVG